MQTLKHISSYLAVASLGFLSACASVQITKVKPPQNLADKPVLQLETSGGLLGGLGSKGDFTLGSNYSGSFKRLASKNALGRLSGSRSELTATIINKGTGQEYQLNCASGSVEIDGPVGLKVQENFTCSIDLNGQQVGNYEIAEADGGIMGPQGAVKGGIQIGDVQYSLFSVHQAEGMLIPSEKPLGYIIKKHDTAVAVIQVQGAKFSLQPDTLADKETDALVIATIASTLRIAN